MRGKPTEQTKPGTAKSIADVLRQHVVLEVEGIDRMYLNVYVPVLQAVEGVLTFIRIHRRHPVASTAMVEPITRRFVESIERFTQDNQVPMITFAKGQRKDDVANQRRAAFARDEGVVFVGKAQEKCTVYRTGEAPQCTNTQELRMDREVDGAGESLLFLLSRSELRPVLSEVLLLLSVQCKAVPERA